MKELGFSGGWWISKRVALAAGFCALGACSSPPPAQEPEPCDVQVVTLNLYAADNVNPNEEERPRPVLVRLYQLKSDMTILNAKYDDILLRDKELLGEDLLKRDDVQVFPNDLVEVKFERIKDATVLCGAAMFRSPKGHSWKTYYVFPPMPDAKCGKEDPDAGEPQADPATAFFVESTKIDNGTQFDESMFPNSQPIRRVALPRRSAESDRFGAPTQGAGPAKP